MICSFLDCAHDPVATRSCAVKKRRVKITWGLMVQLFFEPLNYRFAAIPLQ